MRHYPSDFFPVDLAARALRRREVERGKADDGPLPPLAARSCLVPSRPAAEDGSAGCTEDGGRATPSPGVTALIGLSVGFGVIGVTGGVIAGLGAWGLVACYVLCGNLGLFLALAASLRRAAA